MIIENLIETLVDFGDSKVKCIKIYCKGKMVLDAREDHLVTVNGEEKSVGELKTGDNLQSLGDISR